MKKLLFSILCLSILVVPATGMSSYYIELKNGSTFFTYHYWEEGEQVMFYAHGGVLGVQKDSIKRIEESDRPYPVREKQKPAAKEEKPMKAEPSRDEGQKAVADTGEKEKPPVPDFKAMMKEKEALDSAIEEATVSFEDAKAQNDKERIEEERKRISSLLYRQSRLLKKVRTSSGGDVPEWWNQ